MSNRQPTFRHVKTPLGYESGEDYRRNQTKLEKMRWAAMTCVIFFIGSLLLGSFSTIQAQEIKLVDYPYSVNAMSGDGKYFVSGRKRVDLDLNVVELGDLPGGRDGGYFPAINFDGSICGGYSYSDLGHQGEACLWTEETGIFGLGFIVTRVTGISDDGMTMVGQLGYDDDNAPFYWTAATGVIKLPDADFANGLSADGNVVLGVKSGHGFTWTFEDGYVDLGKIHGAYSPPSDELAISADGSTIVGKSYGEAFRWTESIGIEYLGDMSTNPNKSGHGHDVSADGSVVVGSANSDSTYGTNADREAFIWTVDGGMVSMNTLLLDAGVPLNGLKMETVLFVSDDGRKMLVEARDPYFDTVLCHVDLGGEATDPHAPQYKFSVVNQYRRAFEYDPDGSLMGDVLLDEGNDAPKGVATNEAGTTWIIDDTDTVFVYDKFGYPLGSWKVSGLSRPEGIAVLGQDLMIVDRGLDQVLVFEGAATWIDQRTESATRTWSLAKNKGNKNARGITTDGTSIWVVNSAKKDRVYKYSVDGNYLGRFNLDASVNNKNPRGICTSADGTTLSVVDITSDTAYHYWANDFSGGAIGSFPLNSVNKKPEGIAEVIVR